jgi:uncharacterized protein involved in exopolysaccharide biosynthesis
MTNTANETIPVRHEQGEISLIDIFNSLLRYWKIVVGLPILFACVFGILAKTKKQMYLATASFASQAGENRSVGRAAVLAQQFGFNLDGDRSGQSPQFYEELLRSRTILRRAVESQYSLPVRAGEKQEENLISYWSNPEQGTGKNATWRWAADRLRGTISTNVKRETGVIELTVTTPDASLSEQIALRLLESLNEYNLEVRRERAREETRFIGERLEEARRDLEQAENTIEKFLRTNRDFRNSPDLNFEHERLQRLVSTRQEVYSTLLSSLEQARIDGLRETPNIQIIDSPAGSIEPASKKVGLQSVIGLLFGLMLAVAAALLRDASHAAKQVRDPKYREFQSLVSAMLSELRSPRRWMSRSKLRPKGF